MRWLLGLLLPLAALAGVGSGRSSAEESRMEPAWMSGEEIRSTFSGTSLVGLYPSERYWTESIGSDGSSDYREGSNHWLGRWWIRDREFCFSYPPPGVGGCFRVTRISGNCYELFEFERGFGGDAVPPNLPDLWNGRMWHADRPTTCEARPSV